MYRQWRLWRRPASPVRTPSQAERIRRQHQHLLVATFGLAVVLWAILTVQVSTISGLRVGYPSPVSIQSPRTITFESALLTEQERASAESSPDTIIYRRDASVPSQQRAALSSLLQTITNIRADPSIEPQERILKITALPNSTLVISESAAVDIVQLRDAEWLTVRDESLALYDRAVEKYNYVLGEDAVAELRATSLVYWASQQLDGTQRDLALLFSSSFIRSNRSVDQEATEAQKESARAQVDPVTITLLEGQNIVRQGDPITPEVQERLQALGVVETDTPWLRALGLGILALLVAALLGFYILRVQPQVWQYTRSLIVVYALIAVTLLLARIALPFTRDWAFAFPLAMSGIVITALFHRNLALVSTAILSMLIAYLADQGMSDAAALFIGSAAGCLVTGRPERSLRFLLAGFAVAIATGLTATAFLLPDIRDSRLDVFVPVLIFSAANGLLSAVMALGIYNLAGQLAGIVTPFQLMELAHPNQPLLRKLMREAPGTYYHSIAVGNLAESAAEAIGADALLLRVAAYYHDVGKSIRPYFYTDNQSDRENVHNELDPRTSAEIIAEHVREGANMARAAGLPEQLVAFIPTHHGTSVIKHFYQMALQQEDSVDVAAFSYPGPKPQTREQALLMLADTVEATVRSKSQHGKLLSARQAGSSSNGAQTLEDMVSSIIDERIRSGQLDESPLTLQDIARIRSAFINTLQGIYHPRVEYAPQLIKG